MKKIISSFILVSGFFFLTNNAFAQNLTDGDPSNDVCISIQTPLLKYKSNDATTNGEVSDLQDFLIAKGMLSGVPTGFYGRLTVAAVKAYQQSKGVSITGNVGPLTRSLIQKETCSTDGSQSTLQPDGTIFGKGVQGTITVTNGNGQTTRYTNCTQEVRLCEDGSTMPREGCTWRSDKCPSHVDSTQKPVLLYLSGNHFNRGQTTTIFGTGFGDNVWISLGGAPGAAGTRMITPSSHTSTSVTFTVPTDVSEGTYTLYIVNRNSTGDTPSNSTMFTISDVKPTVSSIAYGSSGTIVVNGSNFKVSRSNEYYLAYKTNCSTPSSCSGSLSDYGGNDTSIEFRLDNNLISNGGEVSVQLFEKAGDSISQTFTVTIPGTNKIHKPINISSAEISQINDNQINVKLIGSGFSNAASMYLNNCQSGSPASFSSNSDTLTGTGYEKTYFLTCASLGTNATVYMKDIYGNNSNSINVYVPTSLFTSNPASIKVYNGFGSEITSDRLPYASELSLQNLNQYNSFLLDRVEIVKGKYANIEVKGSCASPLDSSGSQTYTYGISAVFTYNTSASSLSSNTFSCPMDTWNQKGGSSLLHVATITGASDILRYYVSSSDTWSGTAANKQQPVGQLYFYGVNSDGSTEFLKGVSFTFSIKG